MKQSAEAFALFSKLPVEDLLELYAETMMNFAMLKEKLHSNDETERTAAEKARDELKQQVLTKIKQLYQNIGVDLTKEILKITKNLNENSVII